MSYFAHSDELPEWVAKVPNSWDNNWLKWSVNLSRKRPTEEEQEELPYISNENIASWTGKLLIEELEPAEADSRRFQKNDVLFNKLRPYLAKVYHATFDGVSSGELLSLRPSHVVEPRFLFYVLLSKGFIATVNSETFGTKMPRADWEIVGHQPLPLPPLDTQLRITRFLDEKTAQIDGLIARKHDLLDRLAEKRQALITRAVTRDFDPEAAMKHSNIGTRSGARRAAKDTGGVSYDSGALRYFGRIKNGTTPASGEAEYWDGDVPWATPEDLGKLAGDRISQTKRKVTEDAVKESNLSVLPAGSVIISTRAPIGHMAINDVPMAFNQGCRGIIPGDHVLGPFLYYTLKSRVTELNGIANGTTFVELSRDELAAVSVELPPLETQRRIAQYLDDKTAQIDGLVERIEDSVVHLEKYRSAQITAAVTGQISELQ